jgi:hypothetical protein
MINSGSKFPTPFDSLQPAIYDSSEDVESYVIFPKAIYQATGSITVNGINTTILAIVGHNQNILLLDNEFNVVETVVPANFTQANIKFVDGTYFPKSIINVVYGIN